MFARKGPPVRNNIPRIHVSPRLVLASLATLAAAPVASAAGAPTDVSLDVSDAAAAACINDADAAILDDPDNEVEDIVTECGQAHLGQEPATLSCIRKTGLSAACAQCFDLGLRCVIDRCLGQCLADPDGEACTSCREAACGAPFKRCSGLTEPASQP